MKRTSLKWAAAAAGTLASAICATNVQGQSADALLDKLVDKGILSQKEANELRDESDAGFRKAYQVKSGMPDYVSAVKINGDFRGRYENFNSENNSFIDRSRFRYRLRLGAVATIKDNFEVGLRFSSSEPSGSFGGDPISGNTSFQDNGSKKFVYMDLAYGKWTFLNTKPVTAAITIGKMENPFLFSDAVFDGDYTPEGVGLNLAYRASDQHTFKLNGGAFILDELGGESDDPYLYGAQVRWDATWNAHLSSSAGLGLLNIVHNQQLTNSAVPAVNRGNTRLAGTGELANNFNPFIVDASVTYTFVDGIPFYKAAFPVKLAAEYMNNTAADSHNEGYQAGITFGKAGKKGLWEMSYRWKELQGDAWYEELTDSDFGAYYSGTLPNSGSGAGYGAGTNVRGHIAKFSYTPYDALTLGVTYFRTTLISEITPGVSSDMSRLQVDASIKF